MTHARTSGRWRLLLVPARSGAENMARDVALMHRARETGETVFSVYAWRRPTLSFGRNQPARAHYDASLLESRGIEVVRRPTGGRALLHHREVTYSVTARVEQSERLQESYERINRILLRGLRALGVNAIVAPPDTRAPKLDSAPCFAAPSAGELAVGDRKLVGSAQWRDEGTLLQHGSILLEDDQGMIPQFLGSGSLDLPPTATLAAALGTAPSVQEVAGVLFDAVVALEDAGATPLEEASLRDAVKERVPRFESALWTWRR